MIAYLEGRILKKESDRIVLLVQQIGYEVFLPEVVRQAIDDKEIGDEIALYIYHHQTERQPTPVLIGFEKEIERDFFRVFVTVEDIGPLKAARALSMAVGEIARAIEERDIDILKQLKGVGPRTANKIVASLEGKVGKFALLRESGLKQKRSPLDEFAQQVQEVLVRQLGHPLAEAKNMIFTALQRNTSIASAEDLFEEVYRGEKIE
ncbi:MAG: Holliday junction branch migration protein RuvA [Pseudomonadota bacterium]